MTTSLHQTHEVPCEGATISHDESLRPPRGHYEFDLHIQSIEEYEEALEAWWATGGPIDQTLSAVVLEQAKRFGDSVLDATD